MIFNNHDEFVYVMESGTGYVKIGCSRDPKKRIAQIESETGLKITRMKTTHSRFMFNGEKFCHKKLGRFHLFGEWFCMDFDRAFSFICDAVKVSDDKSFRDLKKRKRGVDNLVTLDLCSNVLCEFEMAVKQGEEVTVKALIEKVATEWAYTRYKQGQNEDARTSND